MKIEANTLWTIALLSLIYLMYPLGPSIAGEGALQICNEPSQTRFNYEDFATCELAIPQKYKESCWCEQSVKQWAAFYYSFGVPITFGIISFFVLKGPLSNIGVVMNTALIIGGVITMIISAFTSSLGFFGWFPWLVVVVLTANGTFLLLHAFTITWLKVAHNKSAT